MNKKKIFLFIKIFLYIIYNLDQFLSIMPSLIIIRTIFSVSKFEKHFIYEERMLWINKDKLNCTSATHINHKFNEQLNQGEKSTQKSRNAIRTTRDDPKDHPDIEKLQQLKYRNYGILIKTMLNSEF